MPRKIIYLINPISGTRKKSAVSNMIEKKTSEKKIPFSIEATNRDGDYHFLKKRIQNERITDIVVCGGDGTISAVAGALLDTDVNFGIVPMGSGNGLALSAKIPATPAKALDIIFNGTPDYVDGFYINEHFSCMLCGIGFDAQVAHDFSTSPKRGLQNYIRISAINFFKAHSYRFSIRSSNSSFDTEAFFICIANSNQFGNNFRIAPQASLRDGLLDIVVVKKMNKMMLPFSIAGQVTGINALQRLSDYVDRKNIFYFQTDSLTIGNEQMAPLHIDGDPALSANEFHISVQPKAFRLLQPVP